jgi:hypothetical protein
MTGGRGEGDDDGDDDEDDHQLDEGEASAMYGGSGGRGMGESAPGTWWPRGEANAVGVQK